MKIRQQTLRGFYEELVRLDPESYELHFLRSYNDPPSLFTPEEREVFGRLVTNLNGMYASGQTTWTEVIMARWPRVGYIPEFAAGRQYRPGEIPGKFVKIVSRTEWHRRRKLGELLLPCRRGRAGTGREKLTAHLVSDVRDAIASGAATLINMNVLRLSQLDAGVDPPIPSLLTVVSRRTHRLLQQMRGLPPTDAAGLSVYGIPLPEGMRVAGVVPLQTCLVRNVKSLTEASRRERVIQVTLRKLREPLTRIERQLVGLSDSDMSREELLRRVLFRQTNCTDQGHDWIWASAEALLRQQSGG